MSDRPASVPGQVGDVVKMPSKWPGEWEVAQVDFVQTIGSTGVTEVRVLTPKYLFLTLRKHAFLIRSIRFSFLESIPLLFRRRISFLFPAAWFVQKGTVPC
jgi:hypothetical protein